MTEQSTKKSLDFGAFMRLVLDALNAAEVTYLIGGAVGLWAWGATRTTEDFDLVVDLAGPNIIALSRELELRDMLVPVDIIIDLLIQPGDLPINAIHMYSGFKAELFLLRPGDPFRQSSLQRRRLVNLGVPLGDVYVHAPEDLILNKVRFYGMSYQPKHVRDIASIFERIGDELDMDYILSWADQLNLTETLEDVLNQAT